MVLRLGGPNTIKKVEERAARGDWYSEKLLVKRNSIIQSIVDQTSQEMKEIKVILPKLARDKNVIKYLKKYNISPKSIEKLKLGKIEALSQIDKELDKKGKRLNYDEIKLKYAKKQK